VKLRLAFARGEVQSLRVDGKRVTLELTPGFDGVSWICAQTPSAKSGRHSGRVHTASRPPAEDASIKPVPREPPATLWKPPQAGDHDLRQWTLIDMSGTFNDS